MSEIDIKQLLDGETPFYPQTDIHGLVNNGEYAIDDVPTIDSSNLVTSNGVASELALGAVYDVTAHNGSAQFVSLQALLTDANLNTLIPTNIRRGGMSIKFVCSSDNKYMQYRLMSTAWSINSNDWERYNYVITENQSVSDLEFSDEQENVLVRFQDGGIKTKNFDSSKDATENERGLMSSTDKSKLNTVEDGAEVNDVETDNTESSDLDFSDEQDNVLARFANGHIKTKNFDSCSIKESNLSEEFLNKVNITKKFENKKIAIIGDSISTYAGWLPSDIPGYDGSTYAHYYPKGNVNNVSKTWWYKLAILLGLDPEINISNCAWSGSRVSGNSSSVTSAAAGCSNRRISDLTLRFNGESPDIIICFISCNDWGHNVSIGTWNVTDAIPSDGTITELRAAYALMLNKLHTTYPLSKVFCCTNLDDFKRDATPGWPSNNASGISTYEWNKNIIEVSQALGCEIIDFHRCGINYANIGTYFAVDEGLHPNDAGHTLMANKAYNELILKY